MQVNFTERRASATATIIKAGLLAGTLDICSALLYYYFKTGKNPVNVLKYVASAVFGKSALSGGTTIALAGLLIHFVIAFTWTIIFFLLYPRISSFLKNSIVTGLLYGIFVWLVMNLVIVPMGSSPKAPFKLSSAIINMVILIYAIGLPIAIIVANYYKNERFRVL